MYTRLGEGLKSTQSTYVSTLYIGDIFFSEKLLTKTSFTTPVAREFLKHCSLRRRPPILSSLFSEYVVHFALYVDASHYTAETGYKEISYSECLYLVNKFL